MSVGGHIYRLLEQKNERIYRNMEVPRNPHTEAADSIRHEHSSGCILFFCQTVATKCSVDQPTHKFQAFNQYMYKRNMRLCSQFLAHVVVA